MVLIELAIYDLRVTYSVVALKGGKLEFRPPKTPERTGGVELPEHLEGAVLDTLWGAAMTDAAAWSLLARWPSDRLLLDPSGDFPPKGRASPRAAAAFSTERRLR